MQRFAFGEMNVSTVRNTKDVCYVVFTALRHIRESFPWKRAGKSL